MKIHVCEEYVSNAVVSVLSTINRFEIAFFIW